VLSEIQVIEVHFSLQPQELGTREAQICLRMLRF